MACVSVGAVLDAVGAELLCQVAGTLHFNAQNVALAAARAENAKVLSRSGQGPEGRVCMARLCRP